MMRKFPVMAVGSMLMRFSQVRRDRKGECPSLSWKLFLIKAIIRYVIENHWPCNSAKLWYQWWAGRLRINRSCRSRLFYCLIRCIYSVNGSCMYSELLLETGWALVGALEQHLRWGGIGGRGLSFEHFFNRLFNRLPLCNAWVKFNWMLRRAF